MHRAVRARSQEALRIVNQQKGVIDLLVTDVIMPGMNGPALAKQVRALRPEMKILYMTGYSGEFVRVRHADSGRVLYSEAFHSCRSPAQDSQNAGRQKRSRCESGGRRQRRLKTRHEHVGADVLICPVERSSTEFLRTGRKKRAELRSAGQVRTSAPTWFVAFRYTLPVPRCRMPRDSMQGHTIRPRRRPDRLHSRGRPGMASLGGGAWFRS